MSHYETIIFDIDGTLIDSECYRLTSKLCRVYKIIDEATLYNQLIDFFSECDTRLQSIRVKRDYIYEIAVDTITLLRDEKICPITFIDDMDRLNILSPPKQGAVELLKYLKAKRYTLLILTNWFKFFQWQRLANLRMHQYFDQIYAVDNSFLKPDERSILKIFDNYKKDDCILIGDSLTADIQCANNVGIDSIWVNSYEHPASYNNKPTIEVKKLLDIKRNL